MPERQDRDMSKAVTGDGNALSEAVFGLKYDEAVEQKAAVEDALRKFGSVPAVELVAGMLGGADHDAGEKTAKAVAGIVPALIENLNDERSTGRVVAAEALGNLGIAAVAALSSLKRACDDPALDDLGRQKISAAIEKIQSAWHSNN